MDAREGDKINGLRLVGGKDFKKNKPTEKQKNNNKVRRHKYHSLESYREKTKRRSREYYRSIIPKKDTELVKSKGLPLVKPKQVEIKYNNNIFFIKAYTIPSTAQALGKSKLTIKRWIDLGIIPEPIYVGVSRGYQYYSQQEVKIIAREVFRHEQEYDYLNKTHADIIKKIFENIHRLRGCHEEKR